MVNAPLILAAAFPPSSELLLDRARALIDDKMLLDIAKADYGQLVAEMLAELRPIRDQGTLPTPLGSHLREVLRLTCWSNPDQPKAPPFEPGPTGLQGHQTRLFTCAVLLRAAAEPSCRYEEGSLDLILARSLASSRVVGPEMETALACFLTWQLSQESDPPETIYFALTLLVIAIRQRPAPVTDQVLGTLAEWLLAQESSHRNSLNWNPADPPPVDLSLQLGFWQEFAEEVRVAAAAIPIDEIRANVQLCALLLEED